MADNLDPVDCPSASNTFYSRASEKICFPALYTPADDERGDVAYTSLIVGPAKYSWIGALPDSTNALESRNDHHCPPGFQCLFPD